MIKQTAWKAQTRTEIQELAATHSKTSLSPNGLIALRSKGQPVGMLPSYIIETLIRADASCLVQEALPSLNGMIKTVPENVKAELAKEAIEMDIPVPKFRPKPVRRALVVRVLKQASDILPKEDQQNLAEEAIGHILEREKRAVPERLRKMLDPYFESRRIPIEDRVLGKVIKDYVNATPLYDLANGPDMRTIEAAYIKARKSERKRRFERETRVNLLTEQICEGLYLTRRQVKVVKHFVNDKLDGLSGAEEEFVRSAKERFYQTFKPPERKPAVQRSLRLSGPIKLGSREERMANHQPREKSPKQLCKELRNEENALRRNGKPFDRVEYCISKIEEESQSTAAALKDMLTRRLISEHALVSLFTNGPLTRKIFMLASHNQHFLKNFGEGQLNALARGLTHIGPKGKEISSAKRMFRPEAIFAFLEHEDLINKTHHNGGGVVYLSRRANPNSY